MTDATDLELIVHPLTGSRLVEDYVAGNSSAVALFGKHFADPEAYRHKAAEVDERFDRDARADAARAMHPTSGSPERLERWVEEGGYVVTTGQQPCLFGGPLYTIYKALSAARLARGLEELLGKPVLPLFWVGSEDHDWAEANHTWIVDVHNELRKAELIRREDTVPPLHRIPFPDGTEEVLASFVDALPQTGQSEPYIEILRAAGEPGLTLPDSCAVVLQRLLGPFGLFLTQAADPVVKERSRSTLLRELDQAAHHEALLQSTGAEIGKAGYDLQVALLEGGVNLFLESPRGRERVYRDETGFRLHDSGERISADDLRARVDADPTLLSPNVLLRPVVESAVFPTLSYVGGPGEVAYFAQLPSYFRAFGIEMPVVHPRASITVVESKIRKVLDKFGLDLEMMEQPFHELAGALAREEVPSGLRAALGGLRGAVAKGVNELGEETKRIDPTLKGPVQHVRAQAFAALDELEKKVVQALKRENETALAQVEKAQLHLRPLGAPQERVMNVFYYLARYGGAFLDAVYERCPSGPR